MILLNKTMSFYRLSISRPILATAGLLVCNSYSKHISGKFRENRGKKTGRHVLMHDGDTNLTIKTATERQLVGITAWVGQVYNSSPC